LRKSDITTNSGCIPYEKNKKEEEEEEEEEELAKRFN